MKKHTDPSLDTNETLCFYNILLVVLSVLEHKRETGSCKEQCLFPVKNETEKHA